MNKENNNDSTRIIYDFTRIIYDSTRIIYDSCIWNVNETHIWYSKKTESQIVMDESEMLVDVVVEEENVAVVKGKSYVIQLILLFFKLVNSYV